MILELSGELNANLGLSCVTVRQLLWLILLLCLPAGGYHWTETIA